MSARAYSEPYAYDRRHARNKLSQKNTANLKPAKSADIIPLVPRQLSQSKPIELVYPKYRKLGSSATILLIVGLHVLAFGYFYFSPPPVPEKKTQPPTIKLEKYVPPVIPPQQIQPEKPKPQKKEPPKAIKPPVVTHENPNVVEQVVQAPAPIVEEPKAEPVTGPSADANYLHNPAPVYPEQAQNMGWEGTVILNVYVFADGKVKDINVKQSSGRKILDEAAIQTVKRWSFVPARQGQTNVEAWVEVPIDFRLAQ
ncbi:MAG: energy transducer TonB [Chitinophagaceae bacterium]|nr:MAG: energy transducer TonB [Chitinophagaceae bacterium]